MPQVTIKNIQCEDLVSSQGKPWRACNITVFSQAQNTDVKLSGFGGDITDTWSIGDTVDVDIAQNDRGYWNWRANANTKASPDRKMELLKRIDMKLDMILGKMDARQAGSVADLAKAFGGEVVSNLGNPVSPTEIKAEEIPW